MKLINYLIIFSILLINVAFSKEKPPFKNILVLDKPKVYKEIIFQDRDGNQLDLNQINTNELYILNFWATWCAPCKDEMPSLDLLAENPNLDNLKIFPINIGKDTSQKSLTFFEDLKIKNLEIYFDSPNTLAKKFKLRGLPTTILFNKDGLEFARIIGSIDFVDEKFIKWLSNFN